MFDWLSRNEFARYAKAMNDTLREVSTYMRDSNELIKVQNERLAQLSAAVARLEADKVEPRH